MRRSGKSKQIIKEQGAVSGVEVEFCRKNGGTFWGSSAAVQ